MGEGEGGMIWENGIETCTLSYVKKMNNAIFINMGATRDYPTKCSNSESQRQTPYDITYMWNRKYGINEHTHQKETDSQT